MRRYVRSWVCVSEWETKSVTTTAKAKTVAKARAWRVETYDTFMCVHTHTHTKFDCGYNETKRSEKRYDRNANERTFQPKHMKCRNRPIRPTWKHTTRDDILSACVLCAKYWPKGDFVWRRRNVQEELRFCTLSVVASSELILTYIMRYRFGFGWL